MPFVRFKRADYICNIIAKYKRGHFKQIQNPCSCFAGVAVCFCGHAGAMVASS